jgi:hypothetical protein
MYSSSVPLGAGGVDVLGNLIDKMMQQLKDTRDIEALFDAALQTYKRNNMGKKEYVHKLVTYTISLSALNFLVMHVVQEMRTAIDKGSAIKDTTGGTLLAEASASNPELSFGIQGFIGGSYGGSTSTVGSQLDTNAGKALNYNKKYSDTGLPEPIRSNTHELQTEKDQVDRKEQYDRSSSAKGCRNCGSVISQKAKFCLTCGQKQ